MRRVIFDLGITLDGFIEGPKGEIDWCIMDCEANILDFLSGIDAIFYARISYDLWGNFQPGDDASPATKEIFSTINSKKNMYSQQLNRRRM